MRAFSWSKHNCMSFVFGYLDLPGFPVEYFLGNKTGEKARKKYKQELETLGYNSIEDLLDAHLEKHTKGILEGPPEGLVVVRKTLGPLGVACGLVSNGKCYFLSEDGMVATFPEDRDMYWSIK